MRCRCPPTPSIMKLALFPRTCAHYHAHFVIFERVISSVLIFCLYSSRGIAKRTMMKTMRKAGITMKPGKEKEKETSQKSRRNPYLNITPPSHGEIEYSVHIAPSFCFDGLFVCWLVVLPGLFVRSFVGLFVESNS